MFINSMLGKGFFISCSVLSLCQACLKSIFSGVCCQIKRFAQEFFHPGSNFTKQNLNDKHPNALSKVAVLAVAQSMQTVLTVI